MLHTTVLFTCDTPPARSWTARLVEALRNPPGVAAPVRWLSGGVAAEFDMPVPTIDVVGGLGKPVRRCASIC